MIRPYFSLLLSLSLIPTGLGATNFSNSNSQEITIESIQTDTKLNFNKTGFTNYDSSFQHYLDYTLPAIELQKRLEEEAAVAKKAKADQEARERQALADKQRQLAAAKAELKPKVAEPMAVVPTISNFDYVSLIRERCAALGCNAEQVIRVMYCESGGRANAYNTSGKWSGLFQQDPRYWPSRAARAGVGGASIFDPHAQIIVATQMFASGQGGHWTCK
jgi:hypothetical protein